MLPLILLFVFWLALYGRLGTYAGFATTASGAPASSSSVAGSATTTPPTNNFSVPLPGDSTFDQIYKYFGLPGITYGSSLTP